MIPLITTFRYRPEVDGLRGVAVLAVVLYHAGLGLAGGYVGVDVFFVISGYLITSLIVSELQQDAFSLRSFWERRARRIIPALVAVALATLVAGGLVFLPRDYAELGRSAACLSVFGANIYFWLTNWTGYFAGAAESMPLLHTWSLAVEEQFYLLFPLLLVTLCRFPRLRTRRALLLLIGGGFLTSLLCSVYGVAHHPVAAFYLLPTRAWELLLGAALAICAPGWGPAHRWLREGASYLGLAGILLPCFFYTGATPFPGWAAMPPCLGTALILWGNSPGAAGPPPTSLGRLLAAAPVVFVGLISYSLYLYHWPLFAFSRYYLAREDPALAHRLALVGLGVLLAVFSWRWIETPFRRRQLCTRRRSIVQFAVGTLALACALGVGVYVAHGLPQRLPPALGAAFNPKDDSLFIRDMTADDIAAGRLAPIGVHDARQPVKVVVWGDSHATAALPAFDAVLKAKGWGGRVATHSATAPVLRYFIENRYGLGRDAPRFNAEVLTYIAHQRVPNVVLIAAWSGYGSGVQAALLDTISQLAAVGTQPWIFLQVPAHPYDVSTLCRHFWRPLPDLNQSRFCAAPGPANGLGDDDPRLIEQVRKVGGRLIDPRPAFLNARGDRYVIARDDLILYSDSNHLTRLGAEKMLVPLLEKAWLPYL